MADNETSYPIYNQYAYKDGVGWVMMGASSGNVDSVTVTVSNETLFITSNVSNGDGVSY